MKKKTGIRQHINSRRDLIHLVGCVKCRPDETGIRSAVRFHFEWLLVECSEREFDSMRVPRSLRALWSSRLKMTRDANGYVIDGEWPDFVGDAEWDKKNKVYDTQNPESKFACALQKGVLNLVNG